MATAGLAVLVPAVSAAAADGAARPVPGPVVLLGTGGVRWSDTGAGTPALSALPDEAAVAVASARSVRPSTCPVDGWLAVSAGARAADEPGPCRSPGWVSTPRDGSPASVDRWATYTRLASDDPGKARPGLLGDALARAGLDAGAVGPGAGIALARGDGTVAQAWPGVGTAADGGVDTTAPDAVASSLADQVRRALAERPALLAVDVGAVRERPGGTAAQVSAVDRRVGAVLAALPSTATVVVASLADAGGQGRLQLLAARGPAPGAGMYAGYLRSPSTRQTGLVQTTDVTPTLLAALGVPAPPGAVGSPMTATGGGTAGDVRLARLRDLAAPAEVLDPLVAPFFVATLTLEFLLLVGGTLLVRRRRREGRDDARLVTATAAVAVIGALVPAATFVANLWPWWRAGSPGAALAAAVLASVVPLALVALLGPWRRALLGPAGVAGALTALVLTADVATGSRLSLTALIGGQPLVGGRFYGFSNPGFALFATGALLAAVALADPLVGAGRPRAAAATVAAVGLVATAVDGLPGLGSDFGGPPALIPAFAYLALRVGGVRLTWRRVLAVAVGTVAVLAALAVGGWLRPPQSRTHLGRFVQTVLDGGGADVVFRKAEQNLAIVTSSPFQLVLPLVAVAVAVALARPARWGLHGIERAYRQAPALRPGLAALAVLLVAGFAVNDSGAAIPPLAATLALPLLLAVSLRAGRPTAGRRPGPQPGPRVRDTAAPPV